ncbi:putative transporter slc-17.2 [Crassostrea virginica]
METIVQKLKSWRWRVAYLALFGMITQIMHRNCISFALVCMCKDGQTHNASHLHSYGKSEEIIPDLASGESCWDSTTQSLVLSAYFYGQLLAPFISGLVSLRFGVRRPMALYMFLSSILLAATPTVARISPNLTIALRAVQGFLGSGCLPMYSQLWDEWAPTSERSELLAFTFSGLDLGILVAFVSSGYLCTIRFDNGWPFIFYTYGAVTIVWVVLWLMFVTDSPKTHPYISNGERKFIRGSRHDHISDKSSDTPVKTPWLEILKSGPVWAMITAMATVAFGMTVVFSYLPKYMNDVYELNTKENGIMSSFPFLGRGMSIIFIGIITDKILQRKWISVTRMRKINQCISSCTAAVSIYFVQYVYRADLAILLITVSTAALGGTMSGSYTNALELAPRYASSLSGLAFTINGLGQIIAPMIGSKIIQQGTAENWGNMFLTLAAVYTVGGVVYVILGSSEELPWYTKAKQDDDNKQEESKEISTISVTVIEKMKKSRDIFLKI